MLGQTYLEIHTWYSWLLEMIKFQSGQGVCGSVGGPFDGISLVNWAMKSRWRICCGDCWSGAAGEAKVSGLWSLEM